MLKHLFTRKRKRNGRELTPQLTAYQRQALAHPSIPPAGLPYSIYEEMERDSMIQTCLTVKKLGVLAAPYRIVPASDSYVASRNAAFAERNLARMEGSPLTILHQAMDAFAKGWSVQELVWEAEGGEIWLNAVRPKDPALFGLETDAFGNITSLRLHLAGEEAREVPRGRFVIYINRSSYGRPKGRSDLDAAHRAWQAKQTLLAAWRFHLERFASPTVLGKFQRGITSDEQAAMLAALENLQRHTAIVFPEEFDIATLGGDKEGSAGFMEALDFHNREIARAILGQTLTTDESKRVGSLALGKVHLQVMLLQLESIRRELAELVMTEQVLRPLIELNFGPDEVPRFEFESTLVSAFASGEIA